jgi:hypothetical protein
MKITEKLTQTIDSYTIQLEDGRIAYYKQYVNERGMVDDYSLLIQLEDGTIDEAEDEDEIIDDIQTLVDNN